MEVSKVTNDDGRAMAQLINFLTKGRWDLTGADAEALVGVKRWAASVAGAMAAQLSPAQKAAAAPAPGAASVEPAAPGGFKVKQMGSLDAPRKRSNRKK